MRDQSCPVSRKPARVLVIAAAGIIAASPCFGAITLVPDADYPADAAVFTLDPEEHSPAERGIAGTRHLRQTFQLGTSLFVDQIVLSLRVDTTAGGLIVNFYEVDDVLGSSWDNTTPSLVHTLTFDESVELPDSSARLGLSLSDDDVFFLGQRNTGTQGYGIELSNFDDTTNIGVLRHSNSGTDVYTTGYFYTESGAISNVTRDIGVAIVPEPSTYAALFGFAALSVALWTRRRARANG